MRTSHHTARCEHLFASGDCTWPQLCLLAQHACPQALLWLQYLDSTTQTSATLIEPFQLEACFEDLPVPLLPGSSARQPVGLLLPTVGATPVASPAAAKAATQSSFGASHLGSQEDGAEEMRTPRKGAAGAPVQQSVSELYLPPPFFHAGLPLHDLACLSARQLPQHGGKSVGLQVGP
jgi:hypothetical protein